MHALSILLGTRGPRRGPLETQVRVFTPSVTGEGSWDEWVSPTPPPSLYFSSRTDSPEPLRET